MTAAELIKILESVDPQSEVWVNRYEENTLSAQQVLSVRLQIMQNHVVING